jgi:hypothetical protein
MPYKKCVLKTIEFAKISKDYLDCFEFLKPFKGSLNTAGEGTA